MHPNANPVGAERRKPAQGEEFRLCDSVVCQERFASTPPAASPISSCSSVVSLKNAAVPLPQKLFSRPSDGGTDVSRACPVGVVVEQVVFPEVDAEFRVRPGADDVHELAHGGLEVIRRNVDTLKLPYLEVPMDDADDYARRMHWLNSPYIPITSLSGLPPLDKPDEVFSPPSSIKMVQANMQTRVLPPKVEADGKLKYSAVINPQGTGNFEEGSGVADGRDKYSAEKTPLESAPAYRSRERMGKGKNDVGEVRVEKILKKGVTQEEQGGWKESEGDDADEIGEGGSDAGERASEGGVGRELGESRIVWWKENPQSREKRMSASMEIS